MKVLSIIQARIGSTRLQRKVMMTIQEKTIIEHIINFLQHSKYTNKVIVATTNLKEDDELETLLNHLGIDCFRGSADNVLERYYECAKYFNGDLIVRITADNPLVDPTIIDKAIFLCKETKCDYATNLLTPTFPTGYSAEVLKFSTLSRIYNTQHDKQSKEHVTYHIRNNPHLYDIKEIYAPTELVRPNWRLTMDYKEDFELISEIFSRLYIPSSFIKYRSVVELLDKNPHLLKINEKHR